MVFVSFVATRPSLADVPAQQDEPETDVDRYQGGDEPARGGQRGREGDEQHDGRDGGARHEGRGRRPHELHDEQADDGHDAAAVGNRIDAPEQVAEPLVDQSAEPQDQRHQRRVSDEDHPLIIIGALQAPRIPELEAITARVHAALLGDHADAPEHADGAGRAVGAIEPAGLTFLLRQYLSTDREDLRDALGGALAQALASAATEPTVIGRAAWLALFVEVAALADDERILAAVGELVGGLRADWPAMTRVDEAAASVDACLRAADLCDPHDLVPAAVDQLERIVSGAYRPGGGLAHETDGPQRARGGQSVRAGLADHVRAASALLTAFEITGRLPYSMLAEELMQLSLRELLDEGGDDLVGHCEAARVLCRLAALHDDPAYRGAAVIATDARYRDDAARILAAQSPRALAASPAHAAAYGLALLDLR